MSSQTDFDELIAVAEYTYGSESSEMNQAMVSTPSNHSHIAPTPVYSHNFAPTLTYATNVLSTSMDSHSMAPSSANYPMESLEFEPVIMDHLAIDPALSNGSSTESSYFDLSMTDDSFINNSLDESVSPPTADPTVDQPQSGLLSPALDRRMDLYPVPGGVVPTTAGMEQWIAGFDPEFQLKVFQVIDSITHHYIYTDEVPSSTRFRFPDAVLPHNLLVIQSYLVNEYLVKKTTVEVVSLDRVRPNIPSLPILPAVPERRVFAFTGVPIAAPAVHAHDNYQLPPAAGASGQPPLYPPLTQYLGFRAGDPHRQVLIRDAEHGRLLRQEYDAWHNQKGRTANVPASATVGMPHDAATYRKHIGDLVDAIYDFSGEYLEKDKKAVKAPKRTVNGVKTGGEVIGQVDNIQAQRVKTAPRIVIELAACEMLDAAMQAQMGNVGINNWQGLSGWTYQKYETWEQRFTELCEAVRHSKAIIDNVMKLRPVLRLAAAPEREYSRKYNNKIVNDVRDQQNAVAVDAIRNGYATIDKQTRLTTRSDGRLLAPAPPPMTGPPAKKARKTTGSKRTA